VADSQVSQYRRENDQRFTSDEDLDACFEPDEVCSTCAKVDPNCRCRPDALPRLSPPEWDREEEL
jgi:hypothetical protein